MELLGGDTHCRQPSSSCILEYLEPLRYGLQFLLLKDVIKILQTYNTEVDQLVPNAWAPILSLVITYNVKHLECIALALTYVHMIQQNNKTYGGKGWY